LLKDEIGIFHACLAQAFFGLLVVIGLATSSLWPRLAQRRPVSPPRFLALFAIALTALIYAQLGLGATMRHQHRDLSITDFPLAYGQIIPATDSATMARINQARDAQALSDVSPGQIWLQMVHRFVAAIIGIGIAWFCFLTNRQTGVVRNLSNIWLALVIAQITLGAWTIWSNKAADIATTHVAVGALTFATGIIICGVVLRLQHASHMPSPVHQTAGLVPVSVK
jgi:cytochrome c oxidase assembly protein subunit 15